MSGSKKLKKTKATAPEGKKKEGLGTKKAAAIETAAVEPVVIEKVMADSVVDEEARIKARVEEERRAKAEIDAAIAASLKSSLKTARGGTLEGKVTLVSETRAAKGAKAAVIIDLTNQIDVEPAIVLVPEGAVEVMVEVSEIEKQADTGLYVTPVSGIIARAMVTEERAEGLPVRAVIPEKAPRPKPKRLLPEGMSKLDTEAIFRVVGLDPSQHRPSERRKRRKKREAEAVFAGVKGAIVPQEGAEGHSEARDGGESEEEEIATPKAEVERAYFLVQQKRKGFPGGPKFYKPGTRDCFHPVVDVDPEERREVITQGKRPKIESVVYQKERLPASMRKPRPRNLPLVEV